MASVVWARSESSEHASRTVPEIIVFSVLMLTYAAIFVYATRCLLRPYARMVGRWLLLSASFLMFASTLGMYAIFLSGQRYTSTSMRIFGEETGVLVAVWSSLFALNIVVGDTILAWRVCVIWKWKRAVKITSGLLLFAVFALWVFAVIIGTTIPSIPPSLVMSVWSTGAIAWRAWQHRRLFSAQVARIRSAGQTFEDIFAALVELGAGYTALWIAYLIASYLASTIAMQWLEIVMAVAVPLYPTLAVALVARHRTPLADQLTSIEALDNSDTDVAFDDKWDDGR
ncbi:hypothetical protein PENSPDRAFT_747031 [Peniophora sp. CONT]|nr:hypothetical protein PENSPDRAFT_747031 [Peniophora sp. CONT]